MTNSLIDALRGRRCLALVLAGGIAAAGTCITAPASADFYDGLQAFEGQSYDTALRELEPLADRGDARAQKLVGLMYRDGLGVPQDFVRAYHWLNLAAAANQPDAAAARDELAERMDPGQIAEAQRLAAAWHPPSVAAPTAAPIASATGASMAQPAMPVAGATPLSRVQTMELQRQLAVHGYNPGAVDGVVGQRTSAAITLYQADAALAVDGTPTLALLDHLQFTNPPVRNARALADYGWTSLPVARASSSEPVDSGRAYAGVWSQPPAESLARLYVVAAQEALTAQGYRPGPIDGVAGPRTREAIRRYQSDHGLPATGVVSQALVNHLRLVTGYSASYAASAY